MSLIKCLYWVQWMIFEPEELLAIEGQVQYRLIALQTAVA